jgi:hypothetical protein
MSPGFYFRPARLHEMLREPARYSFVYKADNAGAPGNPLETPARVMSFAPIVNKHLTGLIPF